MPTFQPPFLENRPLVSAETPREVRGLWRHFAPHPNGVTLYKRDGEWMEAQTPFAGDLDDADHVFLGGHIYPISCDLKSELEALGWDTSEYAPYPSDTRFPSGCDYPGYALYPADDLYPENNLWLGD